MVVLKKINCIPISLFLSLSIIIVFILINIKVINRIPCGDSIYEIFTTNFIHIEPSHLIFNLYALYALSRVEEEMGVQSFIWLVVFLLLFNTLIEFLMRNFWKNMKCSIGFSGILFGIATWEIVSKKHINLETVLVIIIMVLGPSIQNKKVSLEGHAIGALSGIIGAVLWKKINKE